MRFIYLIFAVFVCAALLFFCSPPARTEISRVPNSNGTIAAVVAEVETGATVGTITEIYLVTRGEKISGDYIFAADKVENMKLIWSEPNVLIVKALQARIFFSAKDKLIKLENNENQNITIKFDIQNLIPDH
jgi:hypothetical protein